MLLTVICYRETAFITVMNDLIPLAESDLISYFFGFHNLHTSGVKTLKTVRKVLTPDYCKLGKLFTVHVWFTTYGLGMA